MGGLSVHQNRWTLSLAWGSFRLDVDLIGEDIFGEDFADGQVEPDQQLGQGLTFLTSQHGQGVMSLTSTATDPTGDITPTVIVAIFDQSFDVGQAQNGFFWCLSRRRDAFWFECFGRCSKATAPRCDGAGACPDRFNYSVRGGVVGVF